MKRIYLLGHGWHTGLAVECEDVSAEIWPGSRHFPDADFIEVGWGDEGFYRAEKVTLTLTLKALFLPTPSVLHLVEIRGAVDEFFQRSSLMEIDVTDDGFENLCGFIHSAYHRTESDGVQILGPGIYGRSCFFRARQKYFFPRTCNVWTARALRVAGLPVRPLLAQSSNSVMRQCRKFGRVVRTSSAWTLKRAALAGEQPGPDLNEII